jgi:hypothetical protein
MASGFFIAPPSASRHRVLNEQYSERLQPLYCLPEMLILFPCLKSILDRCMSCASAWWRPVFII